MANRTGTTVRRAFRRTDDHSPNSKLLEVVEETVANPLSPSSVLIKSHAIALNYRDANIVHGGNPWHVLPKGVPCSDVTGEVVAVGSDVKGLKAGDRVTHTFDLEWITGKEQGRSWLAADVDGVLADYLVAEEGHLCKIPDHLDWDEGSLMPNAGVTAWNALKGFGIGQTVLIQGTGGVSIMALKLAHAAGCKIILTSSSDEKLKQVSDQYKNPPLITVNYAKNEKWYEEVVRLNGGVGVDITLEMGGTSTLVKSFECTKRGGIVSQVGYLGKQNVADLQKMLPVLIDRRINLRGINGGSKYDLEDLYAAIAATQMHFKDVIDSRFPFEQADEAIEYLWQGKHVGKIIIDFDQDKA